MTHHLIIGGGPVATNAIETIRQIEGKPSEITLVSDEPAHSRMALPYWLSGQIPRGHTHTADDDWFRQNQIDARIGLSVVRIDPQNKSVALSDGSTIEFDDLLIATGASPLKLDIPGIDLPGVQPLWTLDHTQSLLDIAAGKEKPRVAMIGAGFIGFIMLNAMYKRGWQLTVIEREAHVLPRMLDAEAAGFVERWLGSKNIAVHAGTTARSISEADDGAKVVELDDGTKVEADAVIIAVGIKPNLDLLDGSGVETDQGILVDDRMQTNFEHIYAGGDCAQGPVMFSDQREMHPIQPTAVDHGRIAGANMAGEEVRYPGSLSMNVLDACGLQCASFGNWADGETLKIVNPTGNIFRKLCFTGEEMTGAIFIGQANDMGMLTDVGMVKGFLQTQTPLGPWKKFLRENPFDVRRPYVATGVAQKLAQTTLLGRPSQARSYRVGGAKPQRQVGPGHAAYVGTKSG